MFRTALTALLLVLTVASAQGALEPASHPLFDGDAVHEIHLTFDQPDWWNTLVDNYENYEDIPYLAASFDWGAVHFDSIGVRLKGNSSYMAYPGVKKSFKLDIDEYVASQEIDGLDKLNLNNGFLDPSFVRERAAYEVCASTGLATCRTNFAAVYINGDYWGLYTLIEQMDKEFIESRWGAGEDGNLWKGEPHGSFEWLGSNESSYYNMYELKTNETLNDWSSLVDLIDRVNNTPTAALADSLHNAMDASTALAMLAMDLFTVNLDSYVGRCANYYFYHRDLDGRMVFAKWDMNESWGLFNMWGMSVTQLQQLDIHWTNPQPGEDRPLAEQLWAVQSYDDIYKAHIRRLMSGAAQPDTLVARMEAMRDLIRPWVQADPNKMFTNSEFEMAMSSNVYNGPRVIPALEPFIRNRDAYLQTQLGTWAPAGGLVINELMANTNAAHPDEWGDFDDWVEIVNVGASAIDLSGYKLTDHHDGSAAYEFPAVTLNPGEYLVIWCDEQPGQGLYHAPFRLDGDGEDVYLLDGMHIQDQVTWPALASDVPWGRWPDGDGAWQMLSLSTPGAENQNPTEPEVVNLVINEFLAQNNTGIQDEMGSYEDWLELYNPGPEAVELGGLFLTDDLALTTQWALPEYTLNAGEYLVIWCDNDESDGPLHTNFKLSSGGEEVGLYGRLAAGNALVDGYAFGAQSPDISEGREYDNAQNWVFFDPPSPGASNSDGTVVDPNASPAALRLLPAYPNPFNPHTTLSFDLPTTGPASLEVYDVSGRRVSRLFEGTIEAGHHEQAWDGRDDAGNDLPSGVYLALLKSGETRESTRLVLLR